MPCRVLSRKQFLPTLNDITSQKFAQRVIPSHSARCFNTQTDIIFKPSNNFFHYYDFALLPENEAQTMKPYVPNPDHLELLTKINQHDRLAGTLGILPNHLIQLLRITNPEDSTNIMTSRKKANTSGKKRKRRKKIDHKHYCANSRNQLDIGNFCL